MAYSAGQGAWMKAHGICAVYAIGPADGSGPTKIGYSHDLKSRVGGMQSAVWVPLKVYATWYVSNVMFAKRLEAKCHRLLDTAGKRMRGEWFAIPSEWAGRVIQTAATSLNIKIVTHGQVLQAMDRVIAKNGASPDAYHSRATRPVDDLFLQMLATPGAVDRYMGDEVHRQAELDEQEWRREKRLAKLIRSRG